MKHDSSLLKGGQQPWASSVVSHGAQSPVLSPLLSSYNAALPCLQRPHSSACSARAPLLAAPALPALLRSVLLLHLCCSLCGSAFLLCASGVAASEMAVWNGALPLSLCLCTFSNNAAPSCLFAASGSLKNDGYARAGRLSCP
eukprot:TRINITY_DN7390_c0_g2_i3.p2 TRINITY_DN7390_c0_g2~~TRINITY_DN7390_c0_g2_i3.p2  ORF type:complete len:143 (-),score=2.55 TRINITY_DN7390_c0_g2_i3:102-530(-)